ncbi:MAG: hypothetical protein HQK99_11200 [Nitrospirae bacterium]|nr:hypothetical protein [Nitrospirota bacterium]
MKFAEIHLEINAQQKRLDDIHSAVIAQEKTSERINAATGNSGPKSGRISKMEVSVNITYADWMQNLVPIKQIRQQFIDK